MTKTELAERILRNLGHPMIKIELDYSQLVDGINYATSKWKKWATGAATQEIFYTMCLSASQYLYDLPVGTTDVIGYNAAGMGGSINTLFTIDNYMYSNGMYDSLLSSRGDFNLISYHIARDFLDTMRKYTPDGYNFKYHRYTNQLEIQPPPPSGGTLTYVPKYKTALGVEYAGDEITIDSPGWILLHLTMLQGASFDLNFTEESANENFYEHVSWITDYATAYCKKTLGYVRRKFASFGSLGNQGIALDGGELISEADSEMERLMESLRLEEPEVGYSIILG